MTIPHGIPGHRCPVCNTLLHREAGRAWQSDGPPFGQSVNEGTREKPKWVLRLHLPAVEHTQERCEEAKEKQA